MAGWWAQPSLEFGVKVVRVSGMDMGRGGALFVRYYVPVGDGARRLRVDTREVTCDAGDAFWGELVRFERCGLLGAAVAPTAGGAAPAAGLKPALGGGIMFELRWRPPPSAGLLAALLGTTGKGRKRPPSSRVLARAELAWQDVAAASKLAAERWLTLSPAAGREMRGCKALKLVVEVDITRAVAGDDHLGARERKAGGGGVGECCSASEYCGQCGWVGSEEDMFLAATFSQ
jgi:hypothetical protein